MKPLLLLLLSLSLFATLPATPLSAQSGPDRFVPAAAPPAPPPLHGPLRTAPALAEASLCTQVLADPAIANTTSTSPWIAYQPVRSFVTDDQFSSAPAAIFMRADRDGFPQRGPDIDAVGQEIAIPPNFGDLYGSLQYRYAAGSVGTGDKLHVELYQAGQLNPDGLLATLAILDASRVSTERWQELTWSAEPELIQRLQLLSGTQVVLLIRAISALDPGTQQLWLDDIALNLCTLRPSLSGRVSRGNQAVADAQVLLTRNSAAGSELVGAASTDSTGQYSFPGQVPLPADARYQVWYLNTPDRMRQTKGLGFWAGPQRTTSSSSFELSGLDMEVGGVLLLAPEPHAQVVISNSAPVTLRWGRRDRTLPGERHQLCLYDPTQGDPKTDLPLQLCGPLLDPNNPNTKLSFSLGPDSFAAARGFKLVYGRSYRWYVAVLLDGGSQYGYSFDERAITLLHDVPPTEPPVPAPAPEPPALAPASRADWTLMVYMAADNAIGDPLRAPRSALPKAQLAALPRLAAAYPQIRLVSLVDDFGPGGLTLCAYAATGVADCQARPEASSASASTLGDFISVARQRYPADRTALLIVAPANAVGELAYDETTSDAMSLDELQRSYQIAELGGADRLDLVIYQAPLLGNVDTLVATAPYARYMVATPDQLWQLAPYKALVPLLAAPPDAEGAASSAVDAYAQTIIGLSGKRAYAFAAYDLDRTLAVVAALDNLANTLIQSPELDKTRRALVAARAAAQAYDSSGNGDHNELASTGDALKLPEDALIDLRGFVTQLHGAGTAPVQVLSAANTLAELLMNKETSPVITTKWRSGLSISGQMLNLNGSHGLAIFFPSGDRLGGQPALRETYLDTTAPNSAWSTLLRSYLVRELGIGPGGVTEALRGGPRFIPVPGGFVRPQIYLPVVAR